MGVTVTILTFFVLAALGLHLLSVTHPAGKRLGRAGMWVSEHLSGALAVAGR
jgi:hypothetical protein